MPITKDAALAALATVIAPDLQRPITDLGRVRELSVEGEAVSLTVELTSYFKQRLAADIEAALKGAGREGRPARVGHRHPHAHHPSGRPVPGREEHRPRDERQGRRRQEHRRRATSPSRLAASGAKVGLLDADMYGPSVPTMLGVMGRPTSADGQKFLPLERFGVKLMSIGFLLEDSERGGGLARADAPERPAPVPRATWSGASSTTWCSISRPARATSR